MSNPTVPVQNDLVRRTNRLNVYRLLLRSTDLTRAQIARETGLSIPTVTTILGEFDRLELTGVSGDAQPRGGRPAQMVHLDARARAVLSLDLSGRRVRAALVDLKGQLRPLPPGPQLGGGAEGALIGWLGESLAGLVAERRRVAQIAVAVPGVVDQASGHVHLAPVLGWSDYALSDELGRVSGVDVVLENDVNALALAEKTRFEPGAFKHVLFVRIGEGIGASLFIDGNLYRGAGSAAGEIGYSRLPQLGGELTLGAPGPLETHLLGLAKSFSGTDGRVALDTSQARRAFAQFGDTFGLVLHNLVCLLNPEHIVISWPADPEARLVAHLLSSWRGPLKVEFRPSHPDDSAALRGVAQVALERLTQALCSSPGTERL